MTHLIFGQVPIFLFFLIFMFFLGPLCGGHYDAL